LSNYKKDLSDSAHDFIHIVCPKLKDMRFLTGEVIPVEAVARGAYLNTAEIGLLIRFLI
jgi:hypothetical protein